MDIDPRESIVNALVHPILVIDEDRRISFVNQAAEQFFAAGASYLTARQLDEVIPYGSPLLSLLEQVRDDGTTTSEYEVNLGTPRTGPRPNNSVHKHSNNRKTSYSVISRRYINFIESTFRELQKSQKNF